MIILRQHTRCFTHRLIVVSMMARSGRSCVYLTIPVAHFFWLWQKWVYKAFSDVLHGLTYLFNFLTFGHSGAQSWGPECPNVKKLEKGLDQYGPEGLKTLMCNYMTPPGLKGLTARLAAYCNVQFSSKTECTFVLWYATRARCSVVRNTNTVTEPCQLRSMTQRCFCGTL